MYIEWDSRTNPKTWCKRGIYLSASTVITHVDIYAGLRESKKINFNIESKYCACFVQNSQTDVCTKRYTNKRVFTICDMAKPHTQITERNEQKFSKQFLRHKKLISVLFCEYNSNSRHSIFYCVEKFLF